MGNQSGKARHAIVPFDSNRDGKQGAIFIEYKEDREFTKTEDVQQWESTPRTINSGDPTVTVGEYTCRKLGSGNQYQCSRWVTITTNYNYKVSDWKIVDDAGNGLEAIASISEAFCIPSSQYNEFSSNAKFLRPIVLDWNGDGKTDFIAPSQSGACAPPNKPADITWRLHLANDSGGYTSQHFSTIENRSFAQAVEINGDGLSDVLVLETDSNGDGHWLYAVSDGAHPTSLESLIAPNSIGVDESLSAKKSFPIDINADGKTDFLTVKNDAQGNPAWYVYINTGKGLLAAKYLSSAEDIADAVSRTSKEELDARVFDFDGNELPDVIVASSVSSSPSYVIYKTVLNESGELGFDVIRTKIPAPSDSKNMRVADINFDGVQDVLQLKDSGIDALTFSRPQTNLLMSVKQDTGISGAVEAETTLQWASPSENSGLYDYQSFDNARNRSVNVTTPLVESISRPTGILDSAGQSAVRETTYKYGTFVLNKDGRGVLGPMYHIAETDEKKVLTNYAPDTEQLALRFLAPRETSVYNKRIAPNHLEQHVISGYLYRWEHSCDGTPRTFFAEYGDDASSYSCSGNARLSSASYPVLMSRLSTSFDHSGAEIRTTRSARGPIGDTHHY